MGQEGSKKGRQEADPQLRQFQEEIRGLMKQFAKKGDDMMEMIDTRMEAWETRERTRNERDYEDQKIRREQKLLGP